MQNKNNARAQANLAQSMMEQGQIQEAIAIYQKVITLPHPPASIYRQLGDALKTNGQLEEAFTAYQQAIDLQPENAQFHLRQSQLYFKQKKIDQAIEKAEVALQLNPDFIPALNQLALIYEKRNELDTVIRYRQRLVQLKPDHYNYLRYLMKIYSKVFSKKNNIDEVIATYQQVLKDTQSAQAEIAHEYFGEILIKLSTRSSQLDQAINFFQETIKTQSNHYWLHYNLGEALAKQDQFHEAILCYKKAIQFQPIFWQALINLSKLLCKIGDKEQAFQYGIKALKVNPNLKIYDYKYLYIKFPDKWDLLKQTIEKKIEETDHIKLGQHYEFLQQLSQHGDFSKAIYYCQKLLYCQLKKSKPEFVSQYWESGKLEEPNFIIIGVAKCGTTSLYSYLSQHPQFLPAIRKEPMYLSSLVRKIKKIDGLENLHLLNLDNEINLYLAHFPPRLKGSNFVTGEASTSNYHPGIAKIVFHFFQNIKLVTIIRNPIKRALSRYNFSIKDRKTSFSEVIQSELDFLEKIIDFEQAMDDNSIHQKRHCGQGLYFYYIKRWMKLFPREQFLILTNEDLAQNPAGVMKQTFNFLGLPEYDGINYTPRNVGSYPKDIDPDLLSRLQDFYRPHNQRLEEFLERKFNWD